MSVDNQYLPLIRGVVKLSSCLYDSDEVMTGKYNKFKLKAELSRWTDRIEALTEDMAREILGDESIDEQNVYDTLYEMPKDVSESKINNDMKFVVTMCGKLKSAMNDFNESSIAFDKQSIIYMHAYSNALLLAFKKQYAWCSGDLVDSAVQHYDSIGKALLVIKTE